jgi:hypothetical protein
MPSAFANIALAGLCVGLAACAEPAAPRQEIPVSQVLPMPSVSAKRAGAPKVPAVHVGDVRYEQARLSRKEADGGQRLGWLAAYKGDTEELLWRVRVYVIKVDPHLEDDVQDVFFTALASSPDGRQILVDNENGERFAVDIDGDHAVHVRP